MPKMILTWLILSFAIGAGITAWRELAGKKQWQLTKVVAFAIMCSSVAVVLLGFLVVLF